jgi:hypothetical protein
MKKSFRILVVAALALFVTAASIWLSLVFAVVLQIHPLIVAAPIAIVVSWFGVRPLVRLSCWAIGMSRAEIQDVMDRMSGRSGR